MMGLNGFDDALVDFLPDRRAGHPDRIAESPCRGVAVCLDADSVDPEQGGAAVFIRVRPVFDRTKRA